jgi:hypothetical protein
MSVVPSFIPQTVRYLNLAMFANGPNEASTSEAAYIDARSGVRQIYRLNPQPPRRAPPRIDSLRTLFYDSTGEPQRRILRPRESSPCSASLI